MVRRIARSVPTTLVCLLTLAAGARDACAGRADGALLVTARVPVQLDVRLVAETPDVTLTAADLAAGEIDIPDATVLAVRTNSDLGYVLELGLPEADWVAAVEVRAAGTLVQGVPGSLLQIAVPAPGAGETLTSLDLRLRLMPGARAGTYPLPLAVGLAPL
jgi:hypothetical protein